MIQRNAVVYSLITAVYVVDTTSLSYNSSNFSRPEKYSVSRLFSLKNNKLIGKIAIFILINLSSYEKFVFKIIITIVPKPIAAERKDELLRKYLPILVQVIFILFSMHCLQIYQYINKISCHQNNRFWSHWMAHCQSSTAYWENQQYNRGRHYILLFRKKKEKSSMPYSNSIIKQLLDNNIYLIDSALVNYKIIQNLS